MERVYTVIGKVDELSEMAISMKDNENLNNHYIDLMLNREVQKKEHAQIHEDYLCAFGDLLLKIERSDNECTRLQKEIAYCGTLIEEGRTTIDVDEMRVNVDLAMQPYVKTYEDKRKKIQKAREEHMSPKARAQQKELFLMAGHKILSRERSRKQADLYQRLCLAYGLNEKGVMEGLSAQADVLPPASKDTLPDPQEIHLLTDELSSADKGALHHEEECLKDDASRQKHRYDLAQ